MWWEETPASHCFTKLEIQPGIVVYFQAVGSGTEFCNEEYFLSHHQPVYEKQVEISSELYLKILEKAVSLLKVKYSFLHLVGLFYKRSVQYVFHKIIKVPFKDQGKEQVCIQALVAIIDAGEIVRKSADPYDMGMFEAIEMLHAINGKELEIQI